MRDFKNRKTTNSKKNKTPGKLSAELKALPKLPGVYVMKDGTGSIIYVGKAINLKRRVKSYFQGNHKENRKLERLVNDIAGLEYTVTDTELDALLLECRLIKKYKPHYNAALKNDCRYPYIKITKDPYPCITTALTTMHDGARYYGPYKNSDNVYRVIELLRRMWGIRVCEAVFTIGKTKSPCLNYHLKKCLAPCNGNITPEEYLCGIKKAEKFLRGKHSETLRKIKNEMNHASENLLFELAAERRDDLQTLKLFAYRQRTLLNTLEPRELLVFTPSLDDSAIVVYLFRFGRLAARTRIKYEDVKDPENITFKECIEKFLYTNVPNVSRIRSRKRYYERSEIDEILIIHSWLKHSKAKKALTEISGSNNFSLIIESSVNAVRTILS